MKYLKKYPIFSSVLIFLLLAFAVVAAYDIYLISQHNRASQSEQVARKRFESAVKNDPGPENLELAKENIKALNDKLDVLDKDLSRESSAILAPAPVTEGYQLVERLRSLVGQWRIEAQEKQIGIPDNFDFSFKKYLDSNAKPPANNAVEPLWKQANILENILKKLYAAKTPNSTLNIIAVQREILPIELEAEKAEADSSGRRRVAPTRVIRSSSGDTFEVDQFISAKKEGSVSTLGYRIVFSGYTDSMRRFLNNLNSYDLMLVVRSIEVKPTVDLKSGATATSPSPMFVESLADAFDSALSGEEGGREVRVEVKDPVVSENLSEFTIVIEFVEVDKTSPKPSDNKADESDDKEKEGE